MVHCPDMLPRERVQAALAGEVWDVVPTGELSLGDVRFGDLEPDCVGISLEKPPPASLLDDYRARDVFVWGLVDGPFMRLARDRGWRRALQEAADAARMQELARQSLPVLERASSVGVDGIILCDDVAYSRGPFFSPSVFEESIGPAWTRIAQRVRGEGYPLLLHCDGNVEPVLQWVLRCGFDGVHSLEPEAGVDVRKIRAYYGDRLCLMGGIGVSTLVHGTPDDIRAAVADLVLAGGRRFILGTSTGSLPSGVDPDLLIDAYRAGRKASSRTVRFRSHGIEVRVCSDASLLEAAQRADIPLDGACGGRGVCGRCSVQVVSGTVADLREPSARAEDPTLACQTRAESDVVIEVQSEPPPWSAIAVDPSFEAASPRLSFRSLDGSATSEDSISEWDRVLSGLVPAGTEVVHGLAEAGEDDALEAVIRGGTVIRLGAPRDTLGMAIDLGTTTLTAALLDMRTGRVLDTRTAANPQRQYGADVITRLLYADEHGSGQLREVVCTRIGEMTCEMTSDPADILHATVVGNTSMVHLLLDLPVTSLVKAPFTPAYAGPWTVLCRELGLEFHPRARVSILPSIGGFVGADAVAAALATGLWRSSEWRICVDLGTNGEILLAREDVVLSSSTAAGPAFEGVGLECGMPAVRGAVESCAITDDGIDMTVIGGGRPAGLCGSGLVDLLAALHGLGIMRSDGRLLEGRDRPGLKVRRQSGVLSVLVGDEDRTPIIVSQRDIRQLQLAKAAIRSGVDILCDEAKIPPEEVSRVLLTGSFGHSLRPASIANIGLLPGGMCDRIEATGNAALRGAMLVLVDQQKEEEGTTFAQAGRLVELATYPGFQERFLDSISFGDINSR